MNEQPHNHDDVPEQMRVRLEKRERLLASGRNPYPVSVARTHTLREIRRDYGDLEADVRTEQVVGIAGRVVFLRNTGKLCFATLQEGFTPDADGERLQVMLSLADVGEEALDSWKVDVDLGDYVFVEGLVGTSRRGELSVFATSWQMASKALRPLPVLHKDLAEETRVRQRHADLISREEARHMVRLRSQVTRAVRETLHGDGYLEVETPVLQLIHGGAAARPFRTHLNAFDQDMTLRIALELYLKRAMAGGADRVYELGRIYRNEGIDSTHSPEFTMLEAYQSWGDQYTIADLTQRIIVNAADATGSRTVMSRAGEVDLDGPWQWLSVYPAIADAAGEDVTPDTPLVDLQRIADAHDVEYDPAWGEQKLAKELFEEMVEPGLVQPTFVHDFPAIAQPLARPKSDEPRIVEAWDLIIGGMEVATGFSELVDPVIQREVLTEQSRKAAGGDPEAMQLDEDFLAALEQGCPPMGGMGMGLDRLMILLTGAGIRETILFPLLRPQA